MFEPLLSRAESVLSLLTHAAWQAGLLALLVMGLTWLLAGRLHPRWRFALWMVVFARLALPILPATPWSLFRLVDWPIASQRATQAVVPEALEAAADHAWPADGVPEIERVSDWPIADAPRFAETAASGPSPLDVAPPAEPASAPVTTAATFSWLRIATWVWLAGVVCLLTRHIVSVWRFHRERRSWRRVADSPEVALLDGCRRQLGLRRDVQLVVSPNSVGPATCGILRPCVILPRRLLASLSLAEMRLVLLHELVHVRRGDVLWDRLTTLITIFHWFHPVGWAARFLLRRDRELACDVAVLDCTAEPAAGDYGRVILKTVESLLTPAPAPGLVGMFNRRPQSFLERRIRLIAGYRKGTWASVAAGATVLLVLVLCGLTDAQSKPASQEESHAGAGVSDGVEPEPAPAAAPAQTKSGGDKPKPSPPPPKAAASLAGVVVDEEGRPVAKASVWLMEFINETRRFRSVSTDAAGKFSFTGVDPTYANLAVVTERHSLGGMERYDLQPGQVENNLRLVVTKPREIVLRIVDGQGKPVPDVELYDLHWKTASAPEVWFPPEVLGRERLPLPRSDRKGEMLISGVPAGAVCTLVLQHPEFAVRGLKDISADRKDEVKVVLERGAPLTVEAVLAGTGEPTKDVTVRLSAYPGLPALSGKVDSRGKWTIRLPSVNHLNVVVRHPTLVSFQYFSEDDWSGTGDGREMRFELLRKAKITGRVVGPKGEPLEGVHVGFAIGDRLTVTTRSDKEGRYTMEGPEGAGKVAVVAMGGFFRNGGHEVDIRLNADRLTTAPDLVAHKVPPLRGIVMSPDGRPVAQALVTGGGLRDQTVLTRADGGFELPLDQIPDSFAWVTVNHPTERLSGGATVGPEQVKSGELVQIELRRESTLRGQLTSEDGKPLAGVQVKLWERLHHGMWSLHRAARATATDDLGEFVFAGLSRHATYRVDVGQPGEGETSLPRNSFRELADDNVTIELPPLTADEVKSLTRSTAEPKAPELSVRAWINSPPLKLEALAGKVVLLDFWATWRETDFGDAANLQIAYDLYAKRGLVVIGVHHNSASEEQLRKFAAERKLTFPIALDDAAGESTERYRLSSRPAKVLIGRDGRIIARDTFRYDFLGTVRRAVLYGEKK